MDIWLIILMMTGISIYAASKHSRRVVAGMTGLRSGIWLALALIQVIGSWYSGVLVPMQIFLLLVVIVSVVTAWAFILSVCKNELGE